MGALNLKNLSFRYTGEWVLKKVSLQVAGGEFLGLIGPNGSGKTTLLKIMDGIIRPQEGSVELDGMDIAALDRKSVARAVAFVPQENPLTFPFSVMEIVLMGRAPHLPVFGFEGARDIEIASRAMRLTGVMELAGRPMGSLSGGERQRVLIARALAQKPQIMLLDEPTAFLDIRHQVAVFDLVRELRDTEGLTVVSVTHDINLASLYSDRVVLLDQGRIYSEGSPGDVITPSNIEAVYRTRVHVDCYPGSALPRIAPVRNGSAR